MGLFDLFRRRVRDLPAYEPEVHPALEAEHKARTIAPNAIKAKATRHKRLSCGHCAPHCQGTTGHAGRTTCRTCKKAR